MLKVVILLSLIVTSAAEVRFRCTYDILSLIQQLDEAMYLIYLENLTGFGPRVTGTPACDQAGKYIYKEFKKMGLEVRYHNWSAYGYRGSNIEGVLKGIDPESNEIYIICGHYDSVERCPGADDNAAGTSAVLAAAKIMSQYTFNHTIRFLAFSGEEQWMLGSYAYVQEAYLNKDNIVATLNVDMIGYAATEGQARKVRVFDIPSSRWITEFTIKVSEKYYEYIKLEVIPSGYADSDNTPFWDYGYDAIFYWEYQGNPNYHTPNDTIENMNPEYATRVSRLAMATLAELAELFYNSPPETPSIRGPTRGKAGIEYEYSFCAHDPNKHQLYYYISWGDGQFEEWIGPYASGEELKVSHTFSEGTFVIAVKARDSLGAESEMATLEVSMPKSSKTEEGIYFLRNYSLDHFFKKLLIRGLKFESSCEKFRNLLRGS